jgi:hypothetical protein
MWWEKLLPGVELVCCRCARNDYEQNREKAAARRLEDDRDDIGAPR